MSHGVSVTNRSRHAVVFTVDALNVVLLTKSGVLRALNHVTIDDASESVASKVHAHASETAHIVLHTVLSRSLHRLASSLLRVAGRSIAVLSWSTQLVSTVDHLSIVGKLSTA